MTRRAMGVGAAGLLALFGLLPADAGAADAIVVGSKAFTEGYVLGEIAAQPAFLVMWKELAASSR